MDKDRIGQAFDELVTGLYIAQITKTTQVHITADTAQELIDILIELFGEK